MTTAKLTKTMTDWLSTSLEEFKIAKEAGKDKVDAYWTQLFKKFHEKFEGPVAEACDKKEWTHSQIAEHQEWISDANKVSSSMRGHSTKLTLAIGHQEFLLSETRFIDDQVRS
jgi:hypothetical protein